MAGVQGRVALVTGAGSAEGIGFACARVLAAAGARVALTSTTARIFDRQAALPGVFAAVADLTRQAEVDALILAVEAALGPIDIVINNAGMAQTGFDLPARALREQTDEGWEFGLAISLTSAFRLTRALLPGMRARAHGAASSRCPRSPALSSASRGPPPMPPPRRA